MVEQSWDAGDARERAERDPQRLAVATGLWAATLGGLLACSSVPPPSARDVADANDTGRALTAQSEAERAVLGHVASLPTDSPRRIGGLTVRAERPYPAASGRTCRTLHLSAAPGVTPSARLACSDGNKWFFVPDVFATGREE